LRWISEAPNEKAYVRSMKRFSGVDFPDGSVPPFAAGDDFVETPQEVLAMFPNMDIQPGPEGSSSMRAGFIQTVHPLAVDKARVDITVYSSVDDDPETRQYLLENLADGQGSWGKISADDTEAAVRCQIGVRGRGTRFNILSRGVEPGRGGPDVDARDEYSLREFYRVYDEYLSRAESTEETNA
jgi:benzoate/toluate 1,2-dioxygenase alpha subunit